MSTSHPEPPSQPRERRKPIAARFGLKWLWLGTVRTRKVSRSIVSSHNMFRVDASRDAPGALAQARDIACEPSHGGRPTCGFDS
jgi:hypothetical protein